MKKLYSFLIILLIISCYKEDDYSLSKLDKDIVKIYFESEPIFADGESYTFIIVEVPVKTKKEFSLVNIKISNGKFINDKQEIDVNLSIAGDSVDRKIAKTKIISSQKIEDAIIEIKVGDIYRIDTLKFKRAFPNEIKTDLPALTISYGYKTINLTTKLSRMIGKPSLLSKAKIKVIDEDGLKVGKFLNYKENADEKGILVNEYSLGVDTCKCTKIYIVSETLNSESTFIRDTSSLIIN
jgi:hypothetical protein